MSSMRKFTLACAAVLVMTPMALMAQGLPNQDTYFTFSQAVELPGKTLPAGTYLFVLADGASNRHVVRVMSKDRKEVQTTLFAIPSYSLDRPSDKPTVRFLEAPASGPQAIKAWFYPGRTVGHEFIYPREQAMRLARRVQEPVLTTHTAEASASTKDEEVVRIDETGKESPGLSDAKSTAQARDEEESLEGTTTPGQERTAAGPTTTPESNAASADRDARDRSRRRELPRTAGELAQIAITGLGSLMAAYVLRRNRRV